MQNILLNTDSYKYSHFLQYPEGTETVNSYIEARKGSRVLYFGLQMFLKDYLNKPFTQSDIDEAAEMVTAHGLPFNTAGFQYILDKHGGYFPVVIEAIPEGLVIPESIPQVQLYNTDPNVPWVTSFLETSLLRAVWYPTSVATTSWEIKQIIKSFLDETSDDPAGQISFKLHDFGARGVSSLESAGIGGTAHLVNFRGTDTTEALLYARKFYGEQMAAWSVPASEHSTITSWGRDNEQEAMANMIDKFGAGGLYACVSDSYDIYRATAEYWGGALRDKVLAANATLVVRPDSGEPTIVVPKIVEILGEKFGFTVNSKGFKVLNSKVRVIQGDGVNRKSIADILTNLKLAGWSAENVTFGMGGALLQQINRDTYGYAMKANAIFRNGSWADVQKDPVTDHGKRSKAGRLATVQIPTTKGFDYTWTRLDQLGSYEENLMRPVWKDGELLVDEKFSDIRERSEITPDFVI